jgi:hypothetical protein
MGIAKDRVNWGSLRGGGVDGRDYWRARCCDARAAMPPVGDLRTRLTEIGVDRDSP